MIQMLLHSANGVTGFKSVCTSTQWFIKVTMTATVGVFL